MNADPNIFMVEYWLNIGVSAHLRASGLIDLAKQKDQNGLTTPRVEVKTLWSGWSAHRLPLPSGTWFDISRPAKLALKVVTKRTDDSSYHDRTVGTIRYLMNLIFETPGYTPPLPGQSSSSGTPLTLSDRLPYHRLASLVDAGATPSFVGNEMQDVTALSFDFVIQIRPSAFPQS